MAEVEKTTAGKAGWTVAWGERRGTHMTIDEVWCKRHVMCSGNVLCRELEATIS